MKRYLLGVVLVVLSCSSSTDTGDPVVLQVSQINAPASVATGSSFDVNLTVAVGGANLPSGFACLVFDHIDVRRSASDILLTAWGNDVNRLIRGGITGDIGVDVGCAPATTEVRSVTVKAASPGTLTLVVERGRLSPLTATLQVQ